MSEDTKNGNKRGQLSAFARKAGISVGFAFAIETGKKRVTLERAASIYDRTRRRFGALTHADNREANAIVRVLKKAGDLDDAGNIAA
jgi:hypothetical protein